MRSLQGLPISAESASWLQGIAVDDCRMRCCKLGFAMLLAGVDSEAVTPAGRGSPLLAPGAATGSCGTCWGPALRAVGPRRGLAPYAVLTS